MSFELLLKTAHRLQASVEALAALGAELRIRREGLPADPQIVRRLQDVLGALDPNLLDGMTVEQEEAALVVIQSAVGQAVGLLEDPARTPGWSYDDPEVLQGQGQASRRFIGAINGLASRRPDLQRTLHERGAFLDVGTGVGWLAIEAARAWPALRCVGIDVWEPALRLARANLAGSGMEERVELRAQSVEDLEEQNAFTLAWLPGVFMPIDVLPAALKNVNRALTPGGWLVFSVLGALPDRLGEALAALKVARNGAHPWKPAEAEEQLRRLGLEQVEAFSPDHMTAIVVGRKAGGARPRSCAGAQLHEG